ncbi:MOSC domain containing protein [Paenibacillus curdlanolyticus YK9]|uniref:MOSC domain containing protein n=1 Tax=Paenibacillus curdlanolyticus YK9 TaxID=717606 RepID=E0I5W6_9BACL|nr:MOSC domain-containing protein [Paenibacillus curdlanolyticus]EFM12358.1 MOSC domain containing protein [Paenibacillus curdlanolyticus YK9]
MQHNVGKITEINRYPIKSFAGESLESCTIEPYGMVGDRFATFYDETKKDWWKYITVRNIPELFTYQAQYVDGAIRVTASDGRVFGWNEELLDEIQSYTKTAITMSNVKDPHPEHPHLLSVEGASILLITDSSMRKLQEKWGKELDQRRFRGNFIVSVDDEAVHEGDWIGKQLIIGDVQLQVDKYCERCVVITMDPDTREKDPSLLKLVNEEYNLHFGVYASVVKTGTIQLGDNVIVKDV